jgi:hypothetical protein
MRACQLNSTNMLPVIIMTIVRIVAARGDLVN